jgi:outer membrane protein assembly factor BamB
LTATAVVWKEPKNVPEVPSPLVYQNRIYAVMNGGILTCMEAASGKILYRSRIGSLGPYYSAPIAAAGRVYTASGDGVITVFEGRRPA